MKYNFLNLGAIVDRVLQNPIMGELPFESAIRYAIDCIKLIGSPLLFDLKYKEIPIEDYRGLLPEDFLKLEQLRVVKGGETSKSYIPALPSSNVFLKSSNFTEPNIVRETWEERTELKYDLRGRWVYMPFEEGTIDITYQGLFLDEDGYPFILNNVKVVKAVESYIKVQYYTILADLEKISPRALERAEQDYCWYIGAAQNSLMSPDVDERQAITNILTNMFINRQDHSTLFENVGTPESLRRI